MLAILPFVFISCSKDDNGDGNSEKFIGLWALLDYYDDELLVDEMLEFKEDGTFIYMDDSRDNIEFKDGCVYNYGSFRQKVAGTYSVKGDIITLKAKDELFYLEFEYDFYDDDQIKIHQVYGWEVEDGEKVEVEPEEEFIIIHRVKKLM